MVEISLKAEEIGHIFTFPITNTLIMSWLAMIVIFALFYFGVHKLAMVPHGIQNFVEFLYEGILSFADLVTGSRHRSEMFFPLFFTFFIFIAASNWLGILPGIGSIGLNEVHEGKEVFVPLARSANSDLNMTLALAIISVVATHVVAARMIGWKHQLKKYLDFSGPIQFFVGILEILGEFAKMISFSFRLFGNIFAGEVLLITMSVFLPRALGGLILIPKGNFLLSVILPLPFLGLELFVGLIQALIFSTLTLVFLNIAASEDH